MTTDQRLRALYFGPDVGPERDGSAGVPGAVGAGIVVATHPLWMLVLGFSTMSTDSRGPDSCEFAVTGPLTVMYVAYHASCVLTPLALVASFALPRRRRWRRLRTRLVVLSLLPQVTLLGSFLALLALADWATGVRRGADPGGPGCGRGIAARNVPGGIPMGRVAA
ncbi:hypothetical protein ACFW2Y_28185 [Streptomyces sp. NPDC058877]|uniref:hypothetical protein n=1 Tax=Streptomyces sp. NPDC058877 TaxID=3346665 RepID=UPI003682C69A